MFDHFSSGGDEPEQMLTAQEIRANKRRLRVEN
jgi:hypothetical protein